MNRTGFRKSISGKLGKPNGGGKAGRNAKKKVQKTRNKKRVGY